MAHSSAAKKADADFRIAFARRNSRTSRSNSATRAAVSVEIPGRSPESISSRYNAAAAFSPDGKFIAVGEGPNMLLIKRPQQRC